MLYFIFPWLFCNNLFVLLNPFTFFTNPLKPHSHLAAIKMFSACLFCFFNSIVYRYILAFFFFIFIAGFHYHLPPLIVPSPLQSPHCCPCLWAIFPFIFCFSSYSWRRPFNISCTTGLVAMNSFSFFLSGKLFIWPSILSYIFAG